MTEISNLIGRRAEIRKALRTFIQIVNEQFVGSQVIAANNAFVNFGLTDSAIIELSANSYLVLTDDGPLNGILLSKGIDVVSLDLLRKTFL